MTSIPRAEQPERHPAQHPKNHQYPPAGRRKSAAGGPRWGIPAAAGAALALVGGVALWSAPGRRFHGGRGRRHRRAVHREGP